ncbi:MAG: hypothetical protein EBR82_63535 [Caulobacteraceae bacterium]|nr:hypothetical protein [Caulobacteraceae bacterium]
MTVGKLRALLAGMEDDAPVLVGWARGFSPGDSDPAVRLRGLRKHVLAGVECPEVCVDLVYLDDFAEDN